MILKKPILSVILTLLIATSIVAGLPSQTHAGYGDDVRFVNNTEQEVVVTITGAASYFLRKSEEWDELGIKNPGFYKYPNEEIRLKGGESSRSIKEWRIRQAAVRYGGYKGGKTFLLGYTVNDNYVDTEKVWNINGNATVSIKPAPPSSYLGSYTGVSMTLQFDYTHGSQSKNYYNNTNNNHPNASNSSSSRNASQSRPHIKPELKKIYDALGLRTVQPTPYDVLRVDESATQADVKKEYLKLVTKWHPDKHAHGSKEEQKLADDVTKLINQAYGFIYKENKWK